MNPSKQAQLINLCKNNCAKSQMQLYNMYCNAKFFVAYRYINDRFIAEDIMQEAFVKAFQNLTTYKNDVTFGSWLKRIVINKSIDHLKKYKLEIGCSK
jgi:RNA polymerase sigma factor (sigma-70 family)